MKISGCLICDVKDILSDKKTSIFYHAGCSEKNP